MSLPATPLWRPIIDCDKRTCDHNRLANTIRTLCRTLDWILESTGGVWPGGAWPYMASDEGGTLIIEGSEEEREGGKEGRASRQEL